MPNEAVIIELLGNAGNPVRFTVADGTALSGGDLLKIADPRTVSRATADGDLFAGVCAADKEANDGATSIGAYQYGIFDLYAPTTSATITAGQMVKLSGTNMIDLADDDTVENGGQVVGQALETTATGTAETIAVFVGRY